MDLNQLRCFVSVADELHFGRAAQKLGLLPASLSRHIRLLEESLGTRLMARTTRSVSLTEDGLVFLEGAREILAKTEALQQRFHTSRQAKADVLRIGAIDSAAAGLVPMALRLRRLASSFGIGAQTMPEVWRTMKAIFSGVQCTAATIRSPSFSRSLSSMLLPDRG